MSELPRSLGLCATNTAEISAAVNRATQRLINTASLGWWGCYERVYFNVNPADPYITLPRRYARLINMDVCTTPIRINNEFFEFLPGGPGLKPETLCNIPDWSGTLAGYERPSVPTAVNLTATNQLLRIYITDARDIGLKVLIRGKDQNGLDIYSNDGTNDITGQYLTLASPFVTSAFIFSKIDSITKDITYGDIVLKQVDATTGTEVSLSRYAPGETNPIYRRYLITQLPIGCCPGQATTVTITAIGKLEYVPVYQDTDVLVIGNIEALIQECQAMRYESMDVADSMKKAQFHHMKAIKALQNEQRHYLGEQQPAVTVNIFENAPLSRQSIGSML